MQNNNCFVSFDFISTFVQDFLPTLITYNKFYFTEQVPDLEGSSSCFFEQDRPIKYYHNGMGFELSDLVGQPFIQRYLSKYLHSFFSDTDYDNFSDDIPYRYLNDEEISILGTIAIDIGSQEQDFDPSYIPKIKGEKHLYNPIYKNHTNKEVSFIYDNLSSLLYMLRLILNELKKQKSIISSNFDQYRQMTEQEGGMLSETARKQIIPELTPLHYSKIKVSDYDLNSDNVSTIYNEIKQALYSNYKSSKVLSENVYLDLIISYKMIEIQIEYINSLIDKTIEYHVMCGQLKIAKSRELFAPRLSQLMEEQEVDAKTVQSWLGVTFKTSSDYKIGKSIPDHPKLILLSAHLGVSIDYLLGNSDTKNPKYEATSKSFETFGFSSSAYNKLYYYRKDIPDIYAKLITTLNLLLEQPSTDILLRLTHYMTNHPNNHYSTHNITDIVAFQEKISSLLDANSDTNLIKQTMMDFKKDFSKFPKGKLDDTILFDLLRALMLFKEDEAYNIKDIENNITSYNKSLVIEEEDEDYWGYHDNPVPPTADERKKYNLNF